MCDGWFCAGESSELGELKASARESWWFHLCFESFGKTLNYLSKKKLKRSDGNNLEVVRKKSYSVSETRRTFQFDIKSRTLHVDPVRSLHPVRNPSSSASSNILTSLLASMKNVRCHYYCGRFVTLPDWLQQTDFEHKSHDFEIALIRIFELGLKMQRILDRPVAVLMETLQARSYLHRYLISTSLAVTRISN